jgi:hypothetical protein
MAKVGTAVLLPEAWISVSFFANAVLQILASFLKMETCIVQNGRLLRQARPNAQPTASVSQVRGPNEVNAIMTTLHNTAGRDCGGGWFCLINACHP